MKPRYRFTLGGEKRISEPVGWKDIAMNLDRDSQMWSLVESIELPFEFYGNTNIGDGGYQYLKEVRDNGVDSIVEFLAEISWDRGTTYETFFTGILDLTTLIEIENKRRFQCTIMRNDAWSKFINRKAVKVNVIEAGVTTSTTNLPSQALRKTFKSQQYTFADSNYVRIRYQTTSTNKYSSIDLPKKIYSEISTKYDVGNIVLSTKPTAFIFTLEPGSYRFDISIVLSNNDGATAGIFPASGVNIYLQLGTSATPTAFTKTNHGTSGIDERAVFTYSNTHTLTASVEILIYLENTNATGDLSILQEGLFGETSYILIEADTTWRDSQADGMFIHDVAKAIVGAQSEDPDYFYSEYFGGSLTPSIVYGSNGCGMLYKLFKGINVREKSLTDYPLSISWDDLWDGLDPIFCLGAGYEYVKFTASGGHVHEKEVLRLEQRSYFFDDSSTSVELTVFAWMKNLEISYDPQFLITSIENGYEKWEAQTLVGTDDPQTKHSYQTRMKVVGSKDSKNIRLASGFYAASVGIEQTRRASLEPSKDWTLDNEVFIVQVDSSGNIKTYSSALISNLLNSSTRYNVRLTPASNFNRWLPWLSIGFQEYTSDSFRFTGGEGNIKMIFNDPSATGCNAEAGYYVKENADIQVSDALFLPFIYRFTIPMPWVKYKAIRDNRRKAIGLTYKNNDGQSTRVILFIKSLKYEPSKSTAELECWLRSKP